MTFRGPPPPDTVEIIDADEAEVWRGILLGRVMLHSDECDEGPTCSCNPRWVEAGGGEA